MHLSISRCCCNHGYSSAGMDAALPCHHKQPDTSGMFYGLNLAPGTFFLTLCHWAHAPHAAQAIWLELQETVHAVDSMNTMTPAEAGMA